MSEAKYNMVYEIKNLLNGKIYVGVHSTDNLDDCYMGSSVPLRRDINHYGGQNFVKRIIMFCETSQDMYRMEAEIVNQEFINRTDVYNLQLGGNGYQFGHKHAPETIHKISSSQKGRTPPAERVKKQRDSWNILLKSGWKSPCNGKPLSEEHKQKLSLARIGRKLSSEHKRNIGLKSLGRKHTDATLAKMRASKLGGKHTEEARRNMSLAHVGIKMSDEAKRKLSEHFMGRRHSEESKQRMRIARLKVVERKRAEAQEKQ